MKKGVVAFVLLCWVVCCSGGTIYVDTDAPGANNGTSWANAYNFLQDALTAAVSGDIIQVAQGTYQPDASTAYPNGTGNRAATFLLKNGVTVKGGYAGYGQADPNARNISAYETILSGDLNGDDGPNFTNNAENSYHVVTGSSTNSTAILDGFTITAGNANGYYARFEDVGAGLYVYNGTPKLTDCTFRMNSATAGGGGIYTYGYSIVPMFVNCRFIGNRGGTRGGAIYNTRSSPTMINCVFTGNNAGQGGAMFDFRSQSHPTLINCTFFGNTASVGGAIKTYSVASEVIKNSILWGNRDNGGTDESAQIDTSGGGTPTVNYSCIQSWTGIFGGTGNTGNAPAFVDANGVDNVAGTEDDDLRLNSGSACIDAGDNTAVPSGIVTDIAGNTRFIDDPDTNDTGNGTPPIVDMGAIEYTGPVVTLSVWPGRLDFWTLYGDNDINSQILYISNAGGGTLNWQISEDCPWLDAVPSAGSCTTEIDESEIAVNGFGLELGRYECELTVYDNNALNSPQTVQVVLHVTEIPPSEFWRDYIEFPNDPFKSDEISENDPGWVKFTMILVPPYDPDIVYFQDSKEYLFHYGFATELLTPFIGMSRTEYEAVSLYKQGQQAALGAVIIPANPEIAEYGIQFIRYDPYTKEEIAAMFNTVKVNILSDPDVQAFYFPSYEQLAAAEANRTWFEAQGIPISSTARWTEGNACYSSGWAMGVLKYFPGDKIEQAYIAKQLLPGDILLTDGVPAEVPFVAGILSLLPSTPSSHVAILAQTFGVPFGHLALAEDANRAQQLVGRMVLVFVGEQSGIGSIGMKDMTGLLTEEEINQILALKIPEALEITVAEPYGIYSANTNGLGPDDIRYFGGKAANFGILRRAIPDNCPNAVALSFQLWNEFLDQTLGNGRTLREEIRFRLSPYTYPPSDLPALCADLEHIREDLFKDSSATSFTQQQIDAIISVLQDPNYGFDAARNIRFRSSTNVEDANRFSGAGLYDSFSGCLADDLDGDTQGPCICDPEESKERGVFRAIRKVFASFYNDNAFLERLRHGVDENEVGMGILVHHSSPDPFELANGVATLEKRQGDPNRYIKLVTQKGAVSVANPEDGSLPEEVSVIYMSDSEMDVMLVRSSNLVILGETVLDWPDDYNDFSSLLVAASEEFEAVTGKTDYLLDFEYKKLLPGGSLPYGGLAVKQIREIPKYKESMNVNTAFLVNEPVQYVTFQGEGSNLYSTHRLKSRWALGTKSMWLTPENLAQSFYGDVSLEYAADGCIRTINGQLPQLPMATHNFAGTTATDGWVMHHLSNSRTYTLTTQRVKTLVGSSESPVVALRDFGISLQENISSLNVHVDYAQPPWQGQPATDEIIICPELRDYIQQQRSFTSGGISITTSFYYADWESMILTYPLSHFVETMITGLTTEPIVLHGYYSQTFHPFHHNFGEEFLFEPRLEPGISQSILDELEAKNIQLIYFCDPIISTLSYEDVPFLVADIDDDSDVDFPDFARLCSRWLDTVCDDCGGADLTGDGRVDMDDLLIFTDQWLTDQYK